MTKAVKAGLMFRLLIDNCSWERRLGCVSCHGVNSPDVRNTLEIHKFSLTKWRETLDPVWTGNSRKE